MSTVTPSIISSELKLAGTSDERLAQVAAAALSPSMSSDSLTIKDISGNSGARTYLCIEDETPRCIIKVQSGGGIMDSHPNTFLRVQVASQVMRESGLAPPILMRGKDFHIEASAGKSVMRDYFHFDL